MVFLPNWQSIFFPVVIVQFHLQEMKHFLLNYFKFLQVLHT